MRKIAWMVVRRGGERAKSAVRKRRWYSGWSFSNQQVNGGKRKGMKIWGIINKVVSKLRLMLGLDEWLRRSSYSYIPLLKKSNPLILAYLITLAKVDKFDVLKPFPLSGYDILDFGCSDGFLSESMALLGASVVGVDSSQDNIQEAERQKHGDPRLESLSYNCSATPELFLKSTTKKFDVVYSGGVAEQIEDLESYIKCCSLLLKPGGSIFISTVNRTLTSFFWTVIIERVLFLAPLKTYQWSKYVQPQEMIALLESNNVSTKELSGLTFASTSGQWIMTSDLSANYIIWARKELLSLTPKQEDKSTTDSAETEVEESKKS